MLLSLKNPKQKLVIENTIHFTSDDTGDAGYYHHCFRSEYNS